MKIDFFGTTLRGSCREQNEDFYFVPKSSRDSSRLNESGIIFAVADGMGGHAAGHIASKLACDDLLKFLMENPEFNVSAASRQLLLDHLNRIFHRIDQHITREGDIVQAHSGMGATLSVLNISPRFGLIAHVGDSRIYRFRNNNLEQLTIDHTFVQDMIRYGEIKLDEAKTHPLRNVLTHVLGTPEPLTKLFLRAISLRDRDRFLICTDGLHGSLRYSEIKKIMASGQTPSITAGLLIKTAKKNGSKDDITSVVIFM